MLYLKLLKYLQCIFFILFIITSPLMLIYYSGQAYVDEKIEAQKWLAVTSLGSLNSISLIKCDSSDLSDLFYIRNFLGFECPENMKISSLKQFGLANGSETCMGEGLDVKVSTVCNLGEGTTDYVQNLFDKNCLGKRKCRFLMDYDKIFTRDCDYEL